MGTNAGRRRGAAERWRRADELLLAAVDVEPAGDPWAGVVGQLDDFA